MRRSGGFSTSWKGSIERLHPLVQPPAPEPQLGDRTTVPFFLRGEASDLVKPSSDQGRGTEASPLHEFVARGQAAQRAVDEALSSIAAANVARATPDSA